MEVELKLLLASRDASALRRHRLLKEYATALPHEQTLSDTYFDTPDLRLRHCDAGLRVRKVGDIWVQTMKGGASVHGRLHSRQEWSARLPGPGPDLAALRDVVEQKSAWGRLLRSPVVEDQLMPIFTTHVTRIVWALRLPQGDEVECVLDQGKLECDGRKVPISEVELELKSGDPAHLFDFALALQQDIPVQIGNFSKADRGYALFAPQAPAAVKASALKLSRRMSVEQAFQAIAVNCMAQIQSNESGVAQTQDAESVHQMRVGLRRLRSALGLFKDVLQAPELLRRELDWLTAELGAARDWDVLAASTLPRVGREAPDEPLLAELELAAQGVAHQKHEAAARAVSSARHTRLVLSLTRWVHGCGWRDCLSLQDQTRLTAKVSPFARKMLLLHQRRLLKRGGQLQGASPEARHRIRIAAKKTRYATEFFESLYCARTVRPYVAALSALQDEFGWLNDAAVAGHLLQQLQHERTDLAGSAGFVRGCLRSGMNSDDRKIHKLWNHFKQVKLPR